LSAETLRSRRDLTWNLAKILGEFLAAEILRSRQDLDEISARSQQSCRPKTRRDSRRDLGQNFAGGFNCLIVVTVQSPLFSHIFFRSLDPMDRIVRELDASARGFEWVGEGGGVRIKINRGAVDMFGKSDSPFLQKRKSPIGWKATKIHHFDTVSSWLLAGPSCGL